MFYFLYVYIIRISWYLCSVKHAFHSSTRTVYDSIERVFSMSYQQKTRKPQTFLNYPYIVHIYFLFLSGIGFFLFSFTLKSKYKRKHFWCARVNFSAQYLNGKDILLKLHIEYKNHNQIIFTIESFKILIRCM